MQSNKHRSWTFVGLTMALAACSGLAACGTEDETVPDSGADTGGSDAGVDTGRPAPGRTRVGVRKKDVRVAVSAR